MYSRNTIQLEYQQVIFLFVAVLILFPFSLQLLLRPLLQILSASSPEFLFTSVHECTCAQIPLLYMVLRHERSLKSAFSL